MKRISYFNFVLLYFIILFMSQAILRFITTHESIAAVILSLSAMGIFYAIIHCRRWFLLTYPFGIKGTSSLFEEPIRIFCLNGVWYKSGFRLRFTALRKINLKQINLRFVEKRCPCIIGKAQDAPKDIISVKNVIFPPQKLDADIYWEDDTVGGLEGNFKHPLPLSQGNVFALDVEPNINVPKLWKGYISLDNSSGEEKRTFTRKRVIITNELI